MLNGSSLKFFINALCLFYICDHFVFKSHLYLPLELFLYPHLVILFSILISEAEKKKGEAN